MPRQPKRAWSNTAQRLLAEIDLAARQCTAYSERHIFTYAVIGVLSPSITLVDHFIADSQIETFYIRLLTASVCLPGLFRGSLPKWLEANFHIYFTIATATVFPFGYGAMLSLNAANAPASVEIHMQWILQYFIAIFIFIQVVPSRLLASWLWILATIAAVAPVVLVENRNIEELNRVLVYPIPAFLTAIGLGILTNRHTELLETERILAASAIGASLAHEIRTPLASIRLLCRGVDRLLPILVDGYEKALEAGFKVEPLRTTQLASLRRAIQKIEKEVQHSNTIIDMLLVNTANKPLSAEDAEPFSARECIEHSVSRYPFNNQGERSLVFVEAKDGFQILAPRLLIVHVLFNLIKNALQHVQKKKGAWVEITTVPGRTENKIIVHDNGVGIPAYALPHVFDRFYTTNATGQGAGIGLSFCRMVMESIGGKITCDSVEGEFTTFTLAFKKV